MERGAPRRDLTLGLVLMAVTAVGFWQVHANPNVAGLDFGNDPGPSLFPILLLWGLGLSGVWLTGQAMVRGRGSLWAPIRPPRGGWGRLMVPGVMVATLVAYVLTLPRFGFLSVTAPFTTLWVLLLAIEERGRPTGTRLVLHVAEAGALSGIIYFVFAKLVKVPLP